MFGSLGGPEIIFIFVLALLLFGPRKLPQIGRTVGKTLSELRKATHDFRSTLEHEIDTEQVRAAKNELHSVAKAANDAARDVARVTREPQSLLREPDEREPAEASTEPTEPEPSS